MKARDIVPILEPFLLKKRVKTIDKVLKSRISSIILVLENIHDIHNISAILRSAEALGIQHVIIAGGEGEINKDVSICAESWLTIERLKSIKDLPDIIPKAKIFATDLKADSKAINTIKFTNPSAIVLGNEHDGISEECREIAHERFHLPLNGFTKSLNVSVAGALILYEAIEYQKKKGCISYLSEDEKLILKAGWYKKSIKESDKILKIKSN